MKVFIKNKLFSVRGNSSVQDESGKDVFFVRGKLFSPTHVKFVCGPDKEKLYKVRNKWFNFFAYRAYVYNENGEKVACVKHPPFGGKRFVVEGYQDEIYIDGEFFSPRSSILRNGKPIGTIDRQFTVVRDAFCLEGDDADLPFLIALVIAIDNIYDKITK